jgi:hypothetical protein
MYWRDNYPILGCHSCGYIKFCLLGYNADESSESKRTYQRNISPSFPWSKTKQSKKQAEEAGAKLTETHAPPKHEIFCGSAAAYYEQTRSKPSPTECSSNFPDLGRPVVKAGE